MSVYRLITQYLVLRYGVVFSVRNQLSGSLGFIDEENRHEPRQSHKRVDALLASVVRR